MRILRYDRGYSRRKFLGEASRGLLRTGVLMPLWQALAAHGDVSKAYPEELRSIEGHTRGRIKTGDMITAANVEAVKDLLEPVRYEQILKQGRRLRIVKSTTDVMRLLPWEYTEATLKNAGRGVFDARGNVVDKTTGEPWIGGNPFPDARDALQLMAAQTLNWGRHDVSFYAMKLYTTDQHGDLRFTYSGGWCEMSTVARVSIDPKPYWPGHKDKLRYQSVFFLQPQAYRGTSFLNIWDYDQSTFPSLYGYLPEFRRVRQFPTSQRFEPLVPGLTLFLSDAWAAGDPMYTWGNYRIVGRGPFLAGGSSDNWAADDPNWAHTVHGGPKGQTFWDASVELIPETIVVEAEPTGFPRAPVGKKRVWFDARTGNIVGLVTFDRNGLPYRSFDGAFAVYERDGKSFLDGRHPYWSWTHVTSSDIQTNSVTRFEQVKSVEGVYQSGANDPTMYDRYLTQGAIQRLGAV